MLNLALVAGGGAAGAVARYLLGGQVQRWTGGAWPAGTLFVNIVGGLAMGALAVWLASRGEVERWRLVLGVGVLGGFTTFSAFSLEVFVLIERRAWVQAGAYAAASVLLSVGALAAGVYLARRALG